MEWKIILERMERKTIIGAIQALIILAGLIVMFIVIRMLGWHNQDVVWTVTVCVIAGMMVLCWGIHRWTGLDLRKTNKEMEGSDADTKYAIKFWTWTVLLIVGVVSGLWLLWNWAAWVIAKFVGTVQSYR